ncbi:hypothetical protein Q9S36_21240 [Microbacterium sp. ARD31]|uniref:hypothetical protein n=1 Tax=Microbacterium sp. ARD31 TaxID=2962576 RepID=UPI0028823A6B|nr:hypothetical protein [Microbacterium sp. ARD31]MDT0182704.1 hypothetical protein [Microbacterium sp. ARD31]
MTSGLALEFEDVFAGRPGELEPRARALAATAAAITQAADALRDLVDAQRSAATDEIADAAAEASSGLRRAHGRYAGTASALTTFAVDLEPIQQDARAAVADAEYHQARATRLEGELDDLRTDITRAEADGSSTDGLYADLWTTTDGVGFSNGQVAEARRRLTEARREIWDAADRAIDAIETAIEDGADSWRDNWDQFWDGVGDFLSMVGEWASEVLSVVVDALKELLSALVSALVVALMVVAAALLIGIAFLLLGPIGMLVLAGLLAASLLALAIAEVLRNPRRVAERNESTAPTGDADEDARNDAREARDYQDLMAQLARQDAAGGEDATEIRVVAVRDAQGNIVSWRVQLPSTQNWSLTNTDGALNDARTDAMLSLFPGVPTQYEEAVWDAMTQAGVFESDAPIMFTGWSLGGMMAGELATNPRVEGRVQSVFTAGSAIDKHYSDMPDGVRVTQINNGLDPVHTLEFLGLDPIDRVRVDGDWRTYRPLTWPVHHAGMYGAEAERYLPEPRRGDEIFFAAEGADGYEDVYVADYTRGS